MTIKTSYRYICTCTETVGGMEIYNPSPNYKLNFDYLNTKDEMKTEKLYTRDGITIPDFKEFISYLCH